LNLWRETNVFADNHPEDYEDRLSALEDADRKISYRILVIADNSGTWSGNGMLYASRAEAEEAARALMWRWTAVREWKVDEVTH
jgi:hypothetical protein